MKITSSLIIPFIRFFSNAKIMEIATKIGFIKRKRGILPDTIVKVFTFGLANIADPSLNQIASECEEMQPGLEISKNAIYKRLPAASQLLQSVFAEAMKISTEKTLPVKTAEILSQFKDVKICDSTKITLPDKLADLWPGLGGNNAKASLKIQGVYSLLSSCFSKIELTKAPGSDTTYSGELLTQVHEGELLITDLGYYSKEFFNDISAKKAYFLSRIRNNTVIYKDIDGEMKHFKLADFLRGKSFVDEEVLVGVSYQEQLKCRIVAIPLPESVVNERRRKANKKAQYQGKKLTKEESELLAYNFIITNVSKDNLSAEAVLDLYRARWQIELVFKACKSYLKLDKIGQPGRYQLECLIYGRLITVVMTYLMYNILYLEAYKVYGRGMSILLFAKLIADRYKSICSRMNLTIQDIEKLDAMLNRIAKRSLHKKRKKKTTHEMLQGYCFPKNNCQKVA